MKRQTPTALGLSLSHASLQMLVLHVMENGSIKQYPYLRASESIPRILIAWLPLLVTRMMRGKVGCVHLAKT